MRMWRRAITTLNFSAISFVLPLRRIPAVSMNTYSTPSCTTVSSTASRVVPAIGETIARSLPVSVLSSVDLPTFGRPMIATLMPAASPRGAFRVREFGGHVVQQRVHPDAVLGRYGEDVGDAQR